MMILTGYKDIPQKSLEAISPMSSSRWQLNMKLWPKTIFPDATRQDPGISLWSSGTGTTKFWGFETERSDTFHQI